MGRLQGKECRPRRGRVFAQGFGSIPCEGSHVGGERSEGGAISGGEGQLACLQSMESSKVQDMPLVISDILAAPKTRSLIGGSSGRDIAATSLATTCFHHGMTTEE